MESPKIRLLTGVLTAALCAFAASAFAHGDAEAARREPMDFERFKTLVRTEKITTIEALLPKLPAHLRNFYVLMYRSRSLQKASFRLPRAVLFGGDGRFILAFDALSNVVEIIQYIDAERKFEFREVTFAAGAVTFSEANPKNAEGVSCLACHQSPDRVGADPRPNWEPYSRWSAAYGSIGGEVAEKPYFTPDLGPEDEPFDRERAQEPQMLAQFLAEVKPTHPRYRALGPYSAHHTVEMTDVVGQLNMQRVARLLAESPLHKQAPVLAEAIGLCPDGVVSAAEKIPLQARLLARYPHRQIQPLNRLTTILDLVAYPTVGPTYVDWSMDFGTDGRLAFLERFGLPTETYNAMQWAMTDVVASSGKAVHDDDCATLAPAANQQLQDLLAGDGFAALEGAAWKQPAVSAKKVCRSCHDAHSKEAPPIPFENDALLATALQKDGYPHGTLLKEIVWRMSDHTSATEQMPPRQMLPYDTREVFLQELYDLVDEQRPPEFRRKSLFAD